MHIYSKVLYWNYSAETGRFSFKRQYDKTAPLKIQHHFINDRLIWILVNQHDKLLVSPSRFAMHLGDTFKSQSEIRSALSVLADFLTFLCHDTCENTQQDFERTLSETPVTSIDLYLTKIVQKKGTRWTYSLSVLNEYFMWRKNEACC